MSVVRMVPAAMPWVSGGHPLERKKSCPERSMLLIEFAPGFSDPSLCRRSHVIYVVSGELVLELGERVERVAAGEACWVDAGTEHRARNDAKVPVVAFIVSDLEGAR